LLGGLKPAAPQETAKTRYHPSHAHSAVPPRSTALKETQSSKALADFAEAQGVRVTRNAANLPTAFVAEFGSGKPVIGIMGEYDALPGISQKAQPSKEPLVAGAPGHGCGHNLFGVGSSARPWPSRTSSPPES
jgi:hypothetical protein